MTRLVLRIHRSDALGVLILVAITWSLGITLASADEQAATQHVVLLGPDATHFRRWPEAEERVTAELGAAGFRVNQQTSTAKSRHELLHELGQSPFGAVTVLIEGNRGVAYLWLGERGGLRQAVGGDIHSELAAGTLALSVVELFATHALHIRLPPRREAPPTSHPADRRTPEISRHARPWQLSMDFGPALALGANKSAWALGAAVAFAPLRQMKLEVVGHWSAVKSRSDTEAGTVEVSTWDLRGYALWTAVRLPTLEWDIGVGAGPLFARSTATPNVPFEPTTGNTNTIIFSARSRLVFWVNSWFGLLVGVEPGVILPPLVIDAGNAENERVAVLAELGRPWVNAELGLVIGM